MENEVKVRLAKLRKTQRWLLKELRERGYTTLYPTHLSTIISGNYPGGYGPEILALCDEILRKEETSNGNLLASSPAANH